MNTATVRTGKSHHRRQIDSAFASARMADQALNALINALGADASLAANDYFAAMLERTGLLSNEMHDDIDACITAAMEDGFGPEDFES